MRSLSRRLRVPYEFDTLPDLVDHKVMNSSHDRLRVLDIWRNVWEPVYTTVEEGR